MRAGEPPARPGRRAATSSSPTRVSPAPWSCCGTRDGDRRATARTVTVTVAAGQPWDESSRRPRSPTGWSGIESLSGIPGLGRRHPDPERRRLRPGGRRDHHRGARLRPRSDEVAHCRRPSAASVTGRACSSDNERFVVLEVTFGLAVSPLSAPIRYAELARTLGVAAGGRRAAGRGPRRGADAARRQGHGARPGGPRHVLGGVVLHEPGRSPPRLSPWSARPAANRPRWPRRTAMVKLSAAWLIERAGFGKGYGDRRAAWPCPASTRSR